MRAYERLLKYVKIHTTSDPASGTHPSTLRQFDLAKILVEELKELGLTLPEAPAKGGVYTPCKLTEDGYAYISGCGPVIGGVQAAGKLGQEYSVEEGQKFAQNCMLNVLAVLGKKIGDLNRVADVVKILVFVASADDFYSQPQVANGASNLLVSLFGEDAGAPTRSAVGMNVLPGNIPVEIEAIFKIK